MKKYTNTAILRQASLTTGNSDESATVHVYIAGTATLATIYSDNGVTAITQPFTTNSIGDGNPGQFSFYSAGGLFDIVLNEGLATEVRLDSQAISTKVEAKDYGAAGDGVTDDTAALQSAIDSNPLGTLYLGGGTNTYLCDTITVSSGLTIVATGATIKSKTNQDKLFIIDANDTIIDGVVFDGDSKEVDNNLVSITPGLTGWKILNCTIKNITGVTGVDQYGLKISTVDCEGEVRGCTFKDISNYNPTQTPTSAFNGGIVVLSTGTGAKSLIIDGCVFDNIWTDNINNDIDNSDSDGLRVVSASGVLESGLQVSNLHCVGVQKSGVKVSGCRGAQYSNIYVNGNRTDISMIAGVRFQASSHSIVSDVKIKGNILRGININSSNFTLDGLHFSPVLSTDVLGSSMLSLQSSDSDITQNVSINNVSGTNITRAINFDTAGLTTDAGFINITINNVRGDYKTVSTVSPNNIRRCQKVRINNVDLFDSNAKLTEGWEFERCVDVRLSNVYTEFRRNATVFNTGGVGVSDVSFDSCKFVRPDSESSDVTYRSLDLRYSDGTALTNIKVNNAEVSVPSYDTSSNQTIVKCNLIQSQISDLKMIIRDVGVANPGTACQGTLVDCLIDGVSLIGAGKTGNIYAVQLDSGSTENAVYNVRSDERGVRLEGDDNVTSNVSGFGVVVSDVGTGNTTGTTHLFT